jgi:hypothetical protein
MPDFLPFALFDICEEEIFEVVDALIKSECVRQGRIKGQQDHCRSEGAYGLRDEEYLRLKILPCMLRNDLHDYASTQMQQRH